MPPRPSKQCSYPGCTALTRDKGGRCERHPGVWEKTGIQPERMRGRRNQEVRARHFRINPLCVYCQRNGVIRIWEELDHIIPLSKGGADTDENKQGLCKECHQAKSDSESRQPLSREARDRRLPDLPRSRIPVTIICGPPGSGKSTYLREHFGPNDVLIDVDRIMQGMSGLPEHHTGRQWIAPALDERNRQLRALATNTTHERAWFVIAAPDPLERVQWAAMLGADVVLLRTPLDECIRRINADTARPADARRRMIDNARAWWVANTGMSHL